MESTEKQKNANALVELFNWTMAIIAGVAVCVVGRAVFVLLNVEINGVVGWVAYAIRFGASCFAGALSFMLISVIADLITNAIE